MTPEDGDEVGKKVAAEMGAEEAGEETEPAEAEGNDGEAEEDIPFEEAFGGIAEDEEEENPLEKELRETKDRMLRIAADFENFRKRARRDQEEARIKGREEVLKEILPVFDNLDRAVAAAGDHAEGSAGEAIAQGVSMVQKQFEDGLARFGLKSFSSEGEPFDPNFHEAMAQVVTDEHPPGTVVQEYQKGYMLGERLLRASMVVVAKPKAAAPPPKEEEPKEEEPAEAEPAPEEPGGDDGEAENGAGSGASE